jgi:hypothetical protein
MRKNGAKDCPRCGAATIKKGGCDHMQCGACMTHFCWLCRASFDDAEETGEHLEAVHGDGGLELASVLPRPPAFLIRAALRCRLDYDDNFTQEFAHAILHQLVPDKGDTGKQRTEVVRNGNDTHFQTPPKDGHPDFAFFYVLHHGWASLQKRAENTTNPHEVFLNYLRDITSFFERHPSAATHAFLHHTNFLEDIEGLLGFDLPDGAGEGLREGLDRLYKDGLYQALYNSIVREEQGKLALQNEEYVRAYYADAVTADMNGNANVNSEIEV